MDKDLTGLSLSLSGVKEERDRWSQWIGEYSYSNLNSETLPISAIYAMQYGQALERLIREVVISDPELGPMHVLKADVSDCFYCIVLGPTDAPKLGIVFPSER